MTTIKEKYKPKLLWVPTDSVRVHQKAIPAFTIAQSLCYQANTLTIPVNFFGSRSYDLPFAVEEKDKESYLIFAGWESIQQQFFNQQKLLPIWLIHRRISAKEIEQQAWAYLLKQISCTLSENTFLVHTYQFAQKCPCINLILDLPERIIHKPHLLTEHLQQVGRKRAKRQLKSHFDQLIKGMQGG